MSSPEVWADARARLEAAAPGLGLTVAWPNEGFTLPEPPAPWLLVEIQGELSRPIELGGATWQEAGALLLHVMVPVGTGTAAGLTLRKALANLFRTATGAPVGLLWRDARMDPAGEPDDRGLYRPLSLAVEYQWQDRST